MTLTHHSKCHACSIGSTEAQSKQTSFFFFPCFLFFGYLNHPVTGHRVFYYKKKGSISKWKPLINLAAQVCLGLPCFLLSCIYRRYMETMESKLMLEFWEGSSVYKSSNIFGFVYTSETDRKSYWWSMSPSVKSLQKTNMSRKKQFLKKLIPPPVMPNSFNCWIL